MTEASHEERSGWDAAILLEPKRRREGEETIAGLQVSAKKPSRIADEVIVTQDDQVSFKESVGLMARQEKLNGRRLQHNRRPLR